MTCPARGEVEGGDDEQNSPNFGTSCHVKSDPGEFSRLKMRSSSPVRGKHSFWTKSDRLPNGDGRGLTCVICRRNVS